MASVQLPSILRKFDLIINGKGNGGKVDEIALPKQTPIKSDYTAGGLMGSLKVPMGYEPMETSFKLTGIGDILLGAGGACALDGVRLTFKGHAKSIDTCRSVKVEMIMRGNMKDWDPGTIKKGEVNATQCSLDITYFHYLENGISILERDDLKGTYKIRGTDIYEDQRRL